MGLRPPTGDVVAVDVADGARVADNVRAGNRLRGGPMHLDTRPARGRPDLGRSHCRQGRNGGNAHEENLVHHILSFG